MNQLNKKATIKKPKGPNQLTEERVREIAREEIVMHAKELAKYLSLTAVPPNNTRD